MDNKIEHFVLKEDGRIYWVEKMPDRDAFTLNYNTFERFQDTEYQQALQSAIDNAVEVSNQEEVIDEFFHSAILPKDEHGRKEWKINTIQSIQCSVHVYETNAVRKRLALVTFSQPEREETQEELWDDAIAITGVYYPSTFGRFKVIEELSKVFTITRKTP